MPFSFPSSPTSGDTYSYLTKNWTYNGEGWAAGSDVTAPTLVSATVEHAAPDTIVCVFSEPLDQTQIATSFHSAFAVSAGHTLTASAWGADSRTLNLTTSTDFVNGETKTLAFTQSGSVALQDLVGNKCATFSGAAITDNVLAGGSEGALSVVALAIPASLDLTTVGPDDYYHVRTGTRLLGANLITAGATTNWNESGVDVNTSIPVTWGAESSSGAGSSTEALRFVPTDGTLVEIVPFTLPADTTTRKVRIYGMAYSDSTTVPVLHGQLHIRATLSDASAPEISQAFVHGGGWVAETWAYEFTYMAASASQTLTLQAELDANANGQMMLIAVALEVV